MQSSGGPASQGTGRDQTLVIADVGSAASGTSAHPSPRSESPRGRSERGAAEGAAKPSPTDYLPFLEAARGHEANARASGSLVDAELARLMYAEATRLRLEALYPPERCVECGATVHSHEMKCGACGRARQGVKLGTRHVVNLVRFLGGYDFESAASARANMLERQRKKRARLSEERRAQGLGARSQPNSMRSWATRLGMANSAFLVWVRRKGSLQAAVEHFSPGSWPAVE